MIFQIWNFRFQPRCLAVVSQRFCFTNVDVFPSLFDQHLYTLLKHEQICQIVFFLFWPGRSYPPTILTNPQKCYKIIEELALLFWFLFEVFLLLGSRGNQSTRWFKECLVVKHTNILDAHAHKQEFHLRCCFGFFSRCSFCWGRAVTTPLAG